jgi:hypothetical protein
LFDIDKAKPGDIWDQATGETVAEALTRFETIGESILPAAVPGFLRAGFEVWAFGYGEDPYVFETMTIDDIESWDEPDEARQMWGPFRIDLGAAEDRKSDSFARYAALMLEGWETSPFLDDLTKAAVRQGLIEIGAKFRW